MRRPGILLAAALVLAADTLVLVKAAYNRSGSPATAIELTERELRLERPQRESTALFLRFAWQPAPRSFTFGRDKLEELGYNCSLPLTDPSAPAYYRALPLREVFAVLEYNQAGWAGPGEVRAAGSRLNPVDAGRDFAELRKKHPDTQRFLIVPALVRPSYRADWDPATRTYAAGGHLVGAVVEVLVKEICVPPSEHRVLESLSHTDDYFATPEGRTRGPRYSVVLYYGRNHEPWIGSCRLIAPAQR